MLKKWLYKRWGVRERGFTPEEQEQAAQVFERAACELERSGLSRDHSARMYALAVDLRATGLQLIDIASKPYEETPVGR